MSDDLILERVYEDHPDERVSTHVHNNRGRTITLRVEARKEVGTPYRRYALDLYVVEVEDADGNALLEVRLRNPKRASYPGALGTMLRIEPYQGFA